MSTPTTYSCTDSDIRDNNIPTEIYLDEDGELCISHPSNESNGSCNLWIKLSPKDKMALASELLAFAINE